MSAQARTYLPTLHLARFMILLVAVGCLNFLLPRLLPGSPLSAGIEPGTSLPANTLARLRDDYGLDQPLRTQFLQYLSDLRRGRLGRSMVTQRSVTALIAERLPWTLGLVGTALILSVTVGAAVGTAVAVYPSRPGMRAGGLLIVALGALPEFLVGMALIILFGVELSLFPVGGGMTPFRVVLGLRGYIGAGADIIRHMALPVVTLVLAWTPAFFLISRSVLVPILAEPFMLAARAKGLGRGRLMWHAWRNAAPPFLLLAGLRLTAVATGAAVVERIFAYPGVGMLLFQSVAHRDYPVIQGVFLLSGGLVLTVLFAINLIASALDPRVAS